MKKTFTKLAAALVMPDDKHIHKYLFPLQLGCAVPLGTEGAVHTINTWLRDGLCVLQLDVEHAFNSVDTQPMVFATDFL